MFNNFDCACAYQMFRKCSSGINCFVKYSNKCFINIFVTNIVKHLANISEKRPEYLTNIYQFCLCSRTDS